MIYSFKFLRGEFQTHLIPTRDWNKILATNLAKQIVPNSSNPY